MKIYVTDDFDEFMVKAQLDDKIVFKVANELNNGLHDGDLDMGRLFKKRIPSPRQSKRDSNRSVVDIRKDNLLFFIDGWRKADVPKIGKEIPDKLLETYRLLGDSFLNFTAKQIGQNITAGLLREVKNG
ncbi:type II toxin-antitoxin system RelE/ParE family toxin [uncultured Amphritea sp.]|uniref:type II toxin-antitoxin system RelE/ParE family toxin n=1 Tax=uncultured Amphritea sp. TaxID=981605 RepID=UPI002628F5B0|nr:type II toxin-antitoxin system RelE/ParE family toxin [uncultured Amphritea sp.]